MKNKIITFLFGFILVLTFFLNIIIKDVEVSREERRKMATLPVLTIDSILDKTYFTELDNYLTDQFPFRNTFRKIKGYFSKNIFASNISNGAFIKDDNIFEINSEVNYKSLDNLSNVINKVNEKFFENNNKYFSLIVDKSYFLEDAVKIDYDDLETYLLDKINNVTYIDVKDEIKLEDFYKTDIHIRQDKMNGIVNKLGEKLNFVNDTEYEITKVGSFYGALYSRINSNIKKDDIYTLNNEILDKASVYNFEKDKYTTMYNLEYLNNIDSYDVFLDGATPLLIIENKENTKGKELIVFRDSFGSSLVPLLVDKYSKITVIDLRYFASSMLDKVSVQGKTLKFNDNADVLYIYSTNIANNSFTIR